MYLLPCALAHPTTMPPHAMPCPPVPTSPCHSQFSLHNNLPKCLFGHIRAFQTIKTNFPCTCFHVPWHPTTMPPHPMPCPPVPTSPSHSQFSPHNNLPKHPFGHIRAFQIIKTSFPCTCFNVPWRLTTMPPHAIACHAHQLLRVTLKFSRTIIFPNIPLDI